MNETRQDYTPKGFDDYDVCLGDLMRGERATLGYSLLDVQRELKIKAVYIAAIEDGDLAVFTTAGFIAGYVRSYAKFLGFEANDAYERFCAETGHAGANSSGKNMANRSGLAKSLTVMSKKATGLKSSGHSHPFGNRSLPLAPAGGGMWQGFSGQAFGSTLVLGALVLALGYGGWSVLQEVQRVQFAPVEQSIAVQQETTELVAVSQTDAEIAPALPSTQSSALDQLYRPQELEVPQMVARDGPIAAINPVEFADTSTRLPVETLVATQFQPKVTADGPPPTDIFATSPAWIRVYLADGTVLFEQTLDAGQRYRVPSHVKNPLFRSGNSSSVYVMIGEKTYGPVGKTTGAVKDIQLGQIAVAEKFAQAEVLLKNPLEPPVNLAASTILPPVQ